MVFLGAGIRLVVFLAVIAALILIPLLTVHRARCRDHGERVTRWYFVAPGKDSARKGCRRVESGLEVLLDQVGLR
jgi:hypothetical protein